MKHKLILGLLIGFLIGVGAACGVYFLAVGEVEWETFVQEEAIPTIMIVLSSLGALYVALMPIIRKVKASTDKFDGATADVTKSAEDARKAQEALDKCRADMERYAAYIESVVKPLAEDVKNVEEIVRQGFCNSKELVEKGVAHKIALVGKDNDGRK